MNPENTLYRFENGEIVWHYGFKAKVTFLHESKPIMKKEKDKWYMVQLSNGGFHETQMIEKYNNQDSLLRLLISS